MLTELKKKIKSIGFINNIYNAVYGNRKVERIKAARRDLLQRDGYELARLIDRVLTEAGFRFYLDYGNLMGMVRDGKFMNYDDDLDFSIYIDGDRTWERLQEVMKQNGLTLMHQFRYQGEITEQTYQYKTLTVDFFNHYDDETNSVVYWYSRKAEDTYATPDDYRVVRGTILKVDRIKRLEINGFAFNAPEKYEEYLASIYTKNWRVPDPNWKSENGPGYRLLPGERAKKETIR